MLKEHDLNNLKYKYIYLNGIPVSMTTSCSGSLATLRAAAPRSHKAGRRPSQDTSRDLLQNLFKIYSISIQILDIFLSNTSLLMPGERCLSRASSSKALQGRSSTQLLHAEL